MYSTKDKIIDAVAGTVLFIGFVVLWCAAAIADLATVGF